MEEEAKEYAQRCIHDIQNTIEDAYKSGFSNGYEKGLHENTDPYKFTASHLEDMITLIVGEE
jgi:flagellar biosynthesis/type III secretory pathway protein FliH